THPFPGFQLVPVKPFAPCANPQDAVVLLLDAKRCSFAKECVVIGKRSFFLIDELKKSRAPGNEGTIAQFAKGIYFFEPDLIRCGRDRELHGSGECGIYTSQIGSCPQVSLIIAINAIENA